MPSFTEKEFTIEESVAILRKMMDEGWPEGPWLNYSIRDHVVGKAARRVEDMDISTWGNIEPVLPYTLMLESSGAYPEEVFDEELEANALMLKIEGIPFTEPEATTSFMVHMVLYSMRTWLARMLWKTGYYDREDSFNNLLDLADYHPDTIKVPNPYRQLHKYNILGELDRAYSMVKHPFENILFMDRSGFRAYHEAMGLDWKLGRPIKYKGVPVYERIEEPARFMFYSFRGALLELDIPQPFKFTVGQYVSTSKAIRPKLDYDFGYKARLTINNPNAIVTY